MLLQIHGKFHYFDWLCLDFFIASLAQEVQDSFDSPQVLSHCPERTVMHLISGNEPSKSFTRWKSLMPAKLGFCTFA